MVDHGFTVDPKPYIRKSLIQWVDELYRYMTNREYNLKVTRLPKTNTVILLKD